MYKLLNSKNPAELSDQVSEHLASGWNLHGDPIVVTREEAVQYDRSSKKFIFIIHYQAVTKAKEENTG